MPDRVVRNASPEQTTPRRGILFVAYECAYNSRLRRSLLRLQYIPNLMMA